MMRLQLFNLFFITTLSYFKTNVHFLLQTLDELSDVNDKEKLMMKIWNRFIEPQKYDFSKKEYYIAASIN